MMLALALLLPGTLLAAGSAPVCPGPAGPGSARCHAHVVTDGRGQPNATTSPTGFAGSLAPRKLLDSKKVSRVAERILVLVREKRQSCVSSAGKICSRGPRSRIRVLDTNITIMLS